MRCTEPVEVKLAFLLFFASIIMQESRSMQWYIVYTQSRFEKSVARVIKERADYLNLTPKFGDIVIPTEEVVEMKAGNKTKSERYFFPGYLLVQMDMCEESWHLVRKIPKVIGFVGGTKGKPTPITQAEVDSILNKVKDSGNSPVPKVQFFVGEMVRILEGPFKDYSGIIAEVTYDKNKLKVEVEIFGRKTPVELGFAQVEKSA